MNIFYIRPARRVFAWVFAGALTVAAVQRAFAIVDGQNATNAIGQLDSLDQPAYTKSGPNNSPSNRGMLGPIGGVIDAARGHLFVSDYNNNRVLVYDLDSNLNLVDRKADAVLGQPTLDTNAAATTQGGLSRPRGLALDAANGRLFVVDSRNNRVLVFDVTSVSNGELASRVLGQSNFTSNTAAVSQNGMSSPCDVAYDPATARLFVAEITNLVTLDANDRVLVFDAATLSNGQNAAAVLGQPDFTSSAAGVSQSALNRPVALAMDSAGSRLFVADDGNNRVLVFDNMAGPLSNNRNADKILGQADFTSNASVTSQKGMNKPFGLAYDPLNARLFVTDRGNNRILVHAAGADVISNGQNANVVFGQSTFTGSAAATSQSGVNGPVGLTYDPSNARLYACDYNNMRVMIFNADPFTAFNGENASDLLGELNPQDLPNYTKSEVDNGPNSRGFFNLNGAVIDAADHRLFVSDSGNNRVVEIDLDFSNRLTHRTADHVLGQPDLDTNVADTTQNRMSVPEGLAFDAGNRRLFVADASNNRVLVFNLAQGFSDGQNAAAVLGQPNFTSNLAETSQAGLSFPLGLSYDAAHQRLFVADYFQNRVLAFDGTAIANGAKAVGVLGQASFTSNSAATAQNRMIQAEDVAYDGVNDRLFVDEDFNHRVLVFNNMGAFQNGRGADSVLGQLNFTSNVAASSRNGLSFPRGLGYDSDGTTLFVSDYHNNRVVTFNAASITNGQNAANVLGQSDFTSSSPGLSQNAMSGPGGAFVLDGVTTDFYVADILNSRLLLFSLPPTVPPQSPGGGSISFVSTATLGAAWSASSRVTSYTFAVSTNAANPPSPVAASSSTALTSGVVGGLALDTTYFAFVRACNGAGCSAYVAIGSSATLVNPPVSLSTTSVLTTSVGLAWNANGDPAGTQFIVESSTDGVTFAPAFSTTGNSGAATGLLSGTTYTFHVRGENVGSQLTAPSNAVKVTTLSAPSAPGGGRITNVSTSTLTATWTLSAFATSYTLVIATSAANPPAVVAASSTTALTTATVVGLSVNATYFVFVNAAGPGGVSDYALIGSTVTLANPPVNLSTTSVGATSVGLAWSANGDPSGTTFIVEQSADGTSYAAVLGTTSPNATVTGLIPGTVYWFRARAANFSGTPTGASNVIKIMTLSAPPVPGGAQITNVSTSTLTATWTLSASATSYTLAVATSAANPPSVVAASSATALTLATVGGLAVNTTYFSFVSACNGIGCSDYAAIAATATLANPPLTLAVTSVGATTIGLKWDVNGNPAGTTFVIEIFDGVALSDVVTTAMPFTVTNLQSGLTYTIRVRARNYGGTLTAPSNAVTATTSAAPAAPAGGSIIAVSLSSVAATWASSVGADNYTLAAATSAVLPPSPVTASSTTVTTTATVSGLSLNTTYFISVNACNAIGCSAYAAIGATVTLADAPLFLSTTSVGPTSVGLTWNANGNPPGTTFVVEQSTAGGLFSRVFAGAAASATLSGLTSGVTYTFRVRAINYAGTPTAPSNAVSVTTIMAPSAPSGAAIVGASTSSLSIPWILSSGATVYNVVASSDSANPPVVVAASGATALSSSTLAGLAVNATYFVFVNACNEAGCSAFAAAGSSATFANPPVSLATTSVRSTSFSVAWNANGNPAETLYLVNVSEDGFAFSTTFFVTATTFSLTGLTQGLTYIVSVKARNYGGIETAPSNTLSITPRGGGQLFALSAPVNLNGAPIAAENGPDASITYSWNAVSLGASNNAPVGYAVFSASNPYVSVDQWTLVGTSPNVAFGPVSPKDGAHYYCVRTVADGQSSSCSTMIDNSEPPNYIYPAVDKRGYVSVRPQGGLLGVDGPLYQALVSKPADASAAGDLSVDVEVVNTQTGLAVSPYTFSPEANVILSIPSGMQIAPGQGNFRVEYYNGFAWVMVGTARPDPATNTIRYPIARSGLYRIGSAGDGGVLRSVYPRIFSPNGDGRNDVVLFQVNNAANKTVGGAVFDMEAAKVADLKDGPASGLSLVWDGKDSSGRTVPGGVYVYQIFVGSDRVTGTVVVAR